MRSLPGAERLEGRSGRVQIDRLQTVINVAQILDEHRRRVALSGATLALHDKMNGLYHWSLTPSEPVGTVNFLISGSGFLTLSCLAAGN